ncbi:MAG: mycothiol system anti-sigma-R factor [Buchananella hordeovulneris]|nr:mycothiol system anti-sigma-R factor [Buchananella hordeovulneris]
MTANQRSSCEELIAHLFEYLDREVDFALYEALTRHVEECEHCREVTQAELHVRELLKRSCCQDAPVELRVLIQQSLRITTITR